MDEDMTAIQERADALVESHTKLLRDLIDLREKHHLSQEAIADRMGVTQPTVASFERYDSNPTLATIRRYALAVGARIEHHIVDDCHRSYEEFDAVVQSTRQAVWGNSEAPWAAVSKTVVFVTSHGK